MLIGHVVTPVEVLASHQRRDLQSSSAAFILQPGTRPVRRGLGIQEREGARGSRALEVSIAFQLMRVEALMPSELLVTGSDRSELGSYPGQGETAELKSGWGPRSSSPGCVGISSFPVPLWIISSSPWSLRPEYRLFHHPCNG